MKHFYFSISFLFVSTFLNAIVPSNDTCDNAKLLSITGTDRTVNFTIADAVQNLELGCGTSKAIYSDVWFQVYMPVNGNIIINGGNSRNRFMLMKNGCNGEVVSCFSASQTVENLKAGTFYRLRLFRTAFGASNTSNLSFTIKYDVPIVTIPDANFKNHLLSDAAINTNGDSEIQVSEAAVFNGIIRVPFKNIQDLTGIEAFPLLKELHCQDNNLGSLDVSKNTLLSFLNCNSNRLKSLDVTNNSALRELQINGNPIPGIDLSQCTILNKFNANQCDLFSLDVSNNVYLQTLVVSRNDLTHLDISKNFSLTTLDISYNKVGSFDAGNCASLSSLSCNNNQLSSLNIKNGKNVSLYAKQNYNLKCIQVSDAQWSMANMSNYAQNIDSAAGYSEDCSSNCFVEIPNNAFLRTDLLQNPNINTNLDGILTCQEAGNYTGIIACSAMNLDDVDAKFITYFKNITQLDIDYNNFANIDLSPNTKLEILNCSINQLTDLDLSNNLNLKRLSCSSNYLRHLNVKNGNNTNMVYFDATNNPNLDCIEVDNPTYATANWSNIDAQSSFSANCGDYVVLSLKIYLQGAYTYGVTYGNGKKMTDNLRVANLIPTTSPYPDALTCSSSVFNSTINNDNNAIVDWVWIELRDSTNPNTIVAARSALLQADGDVVDVFGKKYSIDFPVVSGSYYIRVSHRNHLAISKVDTANLSTAPYFTDFTIGSHLLVGGANAISLLSPGVNDIYLMVVGDENGDGQIQNADKLNAENKRGLSGYFNADFNMNGQVQNDDISGKLLPNLGRGEQTRN